MWVFKKVFKMVSGDFQCGVNGLWCLKMLFLMVCGVKMGLKWFLVFFNVILMALGVLKCFLMVYGVL